MVERKGQKKTYCMPVFFLFGGFAKQLCFCHDIIRKKHFSVLLLWACADFTCFSVQPFLICPSCSFIFAVAFPNHQP